MINVRLVLDTDAIIAAMRSPRGASGALLVTAQSARVTLLLSVPLAIEYEAICSEPEHQTAAGLSQEEANQFVTAVIALAEPVSIHYLWRPKLHDPNDEMVLEAAVNGQANAIVTFNNQDGPAMTKITKNTTANYALRLPRSLKTEIENLAAQDGVSVNQFITTAVAEKISAMKTAEFFVERKARADEAAFNRIMSRSSGEPPRLGDEPI